MWQLQNSVISRARVQMCAAVTDRIGKMHVCSIAAACTCADK